MTAKQDIKWAISALYDTHRRTGIFIDTIILKAYKESDRSLDSLSKAFYQVKHEDWEFKLKKLKRNGRNYDKYQIVRNNVQNKK